MTKKNIIVVLILIVIFATLYFVASIFQQSFPLQKCPDDYPDTDAGSAEYLADFDNWTNDFYDSNPGATLTDWTQARVQYWEANNCEEALTRYQEAINMN